MMMKVKDCKSQLILLSLLISSSLALLQLSGSVSNVGASKTSKATKTTTTTTTTMSLTTPNRFQKLFLKLGHGKRLREQVVERYFEGVRQQNKNLIVSCFASNGTQIIDVCGVRSGNNKIAPRIATPDQLGDRCMEFLAAHPDTKVMFHYPPTCGRGTTRWVFAHWYEEGTWSGLSEGIEPQHTPLNVEGQTRFLVTDDLKISEMVVTRTFSDWEKTLLEQKS